MRVQMGQIDRTAANRRLQQRFHEHRPAFPSLRRRGVYKPGQTIIGLANRLHVEAWEGGTNFTRELQPRVDHYPVCES